MILSRVLIINYQMLALLLLIFKITIRGGVFSYATDFYKTNKQEHTTSYNRVLRLSDLMFKEESHSQSFDGQTCISNDGPFSFASK